MSIPFQALERTRSAITGIEVPQAMRALVRAREYGLIAVAALIGMLAGMMIAGMGLGVSLLHRLLFGIAIGERLSSQARLDSMSALFMPMFGGIIFGIVLCCRRCRAHQLCGCEISRPTQPRHRITLRLACRVDLAISALVGIAAAVVGMLLMRRIAACDA